jgi:hypothetical protein
MKLAKIALGVISVGLLTASLALADGPKVSGFVDTSFNVKTSDDRGVKTTSNFGRSFDSTANTFVLNTVNLNLDGSQGMAGYHVTLAFGNDVGAGGTLGGPANQNIQEAYITLRHDENCLLTVGKFVTLEGIEVIQSGWNPTISRGYLFGLAEPFSHTGVKMDHKFGKVLDLTLGAVNGWDTATDNNRDKTWLGRVGLNFGNPLKFGVVYYSGKEVAGTSNKRTSLDITGVSTWGYLAINFQVNNGEEEGVGAGGAKAKWSGYGLQPVYTVNKKFSVGGRYEYFEEEGGRAAGTGPGALLGAKDAYNITITPTWKLSDVVTARAEYRMDNWTSTAAGNPTLKSSTVGGELIYTF